MQKQVNFFEQNVQWFAVGLGGLFLLYMAYAYVIQRPVTVEVDGTALGPGEVETATLNGPVADLQREIGKRDLPDIPIIDYVDKFVAAIAGPSEPVASLSGRQIRSTPSVGFEVIAGPGKTEIAGFPIPALPKLPSARPGSTLDGRSTVSYEDPNFVPRPNRLNDMPEWLTADKDWVSVLFTINGESLAKSFRAVFDEDKLMDAGFRPEEVEQFMETAFVDVQLIRQEVLPGGRLGKEEVVKPLLNNKRPPFPAPDAPDFEVQNYLNYVTETPDDLIKPLFYVVDSGDEWLPPGEKTDQLLAERRAMIRQRTAEEKEAARQQQMQVREQQRAQRMAARGGARRGVPMEFEGEMDFEEGLAGERAAEGRFVRSPAYVPPPVAPGGPRRGQPGRPAVPVVPNTPAVIGQGRFKVFEEMGNIEIIAHDDAVQPGRTYRYKLRYRLLNPVWKSVRAAAPELTKEFSIPAPDSAWSENVKIREKVEFFLAVITNDKAEFDIFYWEKGQMRKDRIIATPGDPIGKTGWSLVDVRGLGRKSTGLLMDDSDGRVFAREPEGTNPGERYQQLLDESEPDQLSATQ